MSNREDLFRKITFSKLLTVLLKNRGLKSPDGRSLFRYKISKKDFDQVQEFLSWKVIELSKTHKFSEIVKVDGFAGLLVLYISEWWKRNYDGTGFNWEMPFGSINIPSSSFSIQQRNECIRSGLAFWRRPQTANKTYAYLGAIAREGGLPLRLLAEERGKVTQVLVRVLKTADRSQVAPSTIRDWIKSLDSNLPGCYRDDASIEMMSEIVWTVLDLKKAANLQNGETAIERLDEHVADWRNRFPISMEDEHARALVEQLVRESAALRPKMDGAVVLPIERFIESDGSGKWNLASSLVLSRSIPYEDLAKLFSLEFETVPTFGEIVLSVFGEEREISIRKQAGGKGFWLVESPIGFSGRKASEEHRIGLRFADGSSYVNVAVRGGQLDEDIPWIFCDERDGFKFVRQGGGRLSEESAVVVLPQGWSILDVQEFEDLGSLDELEHQVIRIRESAEFQNEVGEICRVQLRNHDSENDEFVWKGARLWLDFEYPKLVFKGMPALHKVSANGFAVSSNLANRCFRIGSRQEVEWMGPVSVHSFAGNELKNKSSMLILPAHADFRIKPINHISGTFILSNWGAVSAESLNPQVELSTTNSGDSMQVTATLVGTSQVPRHFTMLVRWGHSTKPVKISLPFPAKGTRAVDIKGREIASGSTISVRRATGTRLVTEGLANGDELSLRLEWVQGKANRSFRISKGGSTLSHELRLSDYIPDINRLISLSDSPDSAVSLTVSQNREDLFKVTIGLFDCGLDLGEDSESLKLKLSASDEDFTLCPDQLAISAIQLERFDEEPIELVASFDEEQGEYEWSLSELQDRPGSWFFYASDSNFKFVRPRLVPVRGKVEVEPGGLSEAMAHAHQADRNIAIDELIARLSVDFDDPAWGDVVLVFKRFGHLPLSSLDLWKRFAQSPAGVVALALRQSEIDLKFIERFDQELPFSWETVPIAVWMRGVRALKSSMAKLGDEETATRIFAIVLKHKVEHIQGVCPSVSFSMGIVAATELEEFQNELNFLRAWAATRPNFLFDGVDSPLMKFRRSRANDHWPEVSLSDSESDEPDPIPLKYIPKGDFGFQSWAINAPITLAVDSVVRSDGAREFTPQEIDLIRTFKAFDPDWFEEAYNFTIARCLSDGRVAT